MQTRYMRTGCDLCQDDLAAWIDCEAELDSATALQNYSHVWWHLLQCATCAATYTMTHTLLDAERSGLLPALPIWRKHQTTLSATLMTLRLTRTFLSYALPTPLHLVGVARGLSNDLVLIDQTTDTGRNLSLCVREQTNGFWIVTVTVTPALDGWLLVTLGAVNLRARFTANGTAIINNVPAAAFLDRHSPDLVLEIEANLEIV